MWELYRRSVAGRGEDVKGLYNVCVSRAPSGGHTREETDAWTHAT